MNRHSELVLLVYAYIFLQVHTHARIYKRTHTHTRLECARAASAVKDSFDFGRLLGGGEGDGQSVREDADEYTNIVHVEIRESADYDQTL